MINIKLKTVFGLLLLSIPVILGMMYSNGFIEYGLYDWLVKNNDQETRYIVNFIFWIVVGFVPSKFFIYFINKKTKSINDK